MKNTHKKLIKRDQHQDGKNLWPSSLSQASSSSTFPILSLFNQVVVLSNPESVTFPSTERSLAMLLPLLEHPSVPSLTNECLVRLEFSARALPQGKFPEILPKVNALFDLLQALFIHNCITWAIVDYCLSAPLQFQLWESRGSSLFTILWLAPGTAHNAFVE